MIKLLSLFSGIGAFESALRRGGYDFRIINYCEIDPYASKAYSQIHNIPEAYNLRDVREVNPLLMDNVNLVTYGYPCQDISIAGKQHGFEHNGERTRSGLFFEALRIIEFLQPEYAIAENVKALTSKKFEKEFKIVLDSLSEAGYNNYWTVLNAKDFGIPQNRERVFVVSIRKDIDTGAFTFPEKQPLQLRVKDMLEPVVDEKYYLKSQKADDLIRQILAKTDIGGGIAVSDGTIKEPDLKDIANCITARYDAGVQNQKSIGTMVIEPVICRSVGRDPDNPSNRKKGCNTEQTLELKKDGLSNTLTTVQKDNMVLEPKIKNIGSINGHQSGNVLHHDSDLSPCLCVAGHVEPLKIMRLGNLYDENAGGARAGNTYDPDGLAPALQTAQGGNRQPLMYENYRIRKLTPRECFRLMGFTDNDFDKIHGISNTQLYKMAGNSIVVNVLEAIFKQLFKENENAKIYFMP